LHVTVTVEPLGMKFEYVWSKEVVVELMENNLHEGDVEAVGVTVVEGVTVTFV
jgi:hypothetical protein